MAERECKEALHPETAMGHVKGILGDGHEN